MRFDRCPYRLLLIIALAAIPGVALAEVVPAIPGLVEFPKPEGSASTPQTDPGAPDAANAERLRVAQRKLEETNPADSAAAQNAAKEVAVLQSIEAARAQQKAIEQQINDLSARKMELETQIKTPSIDDPTTSYSFADLDRLKDELAAERQRASLAKDKLDAAKTALEAARRSFDESVRNRRQAEEAAETRKSEPIAAELAVAAEQSAQTEKLSRETVSQRQKELQRETLALEVQRLAARISQNRVDRIAPLVTFAEEDLKTELEAIKRKEDSARSSLQRAQERLKATDADLRAKQQAFDAESGDRTILSEELETLRLQRERLTAEIDSLTQRLQRFTELRLAWGRRFQIAAASDREISKERWDELTEWQAETNKVLQDLSTDLRAQIRQMRDLRTQLTSITNKAEAAAEAAPEVRQAIDEQRTSVEQAMRIFERNLNTIEDSRRVHEKLAEEIGRHVKSTSPTQWAYGLWAHVENVWGYELTSVEQDGVARQITVGKIVQALALFVTGWILARMFAAIFANRLLQRFRLSKDATAAIRTLVFYILMIASALIALRWAEVPLTAFTILGGALAIGVGFGSQALVNNFIGGLIMLAERPVRLGERIIFGNFDGVVEDVGFRCTKLRTADDHMITIPNSTLVNDSIENTSRRRTIRRLINLTITYDTPGEKVLAALQALRDILEERDLRERIHPIVGFDELKPRVYFNDFNAESLNIQVAYWYAPPEWWEYMEHCERVNLRIMEEFERLGVEFAFPSRTIYLAGDPQRDLEVRLLPNGGDPRKSVA